MKHVDLKSPKQSSEVVLTTLQLTRQSAWMINALKQIRLFTVVSVVMVFLWVGASWADGRSRSAENREVIRQQCVDNNAQDAKQVLLWERTITGITGGDDDPQSKAFLDLIREIFKPREC